MKKNTVFLINNKYFNVERCTENYAVSSIIKEGIARQSLLHYLPLDAKDHESFGIEKMKVFALRVSTENILKAMRTFTKHVILNINPTASAEKMYASRDEIDVLKLYDSGSGHTIFLKDFEITKHVNQMLVNGKIKEVIKIKITNIKKC